jgi:hypothetical protein
MKVSSDFECGNGKNIAEVAPGHWRIEEVGEKAPYCKYFCVRLDAGDDGGPVRLDIYPDPKLGEEGRIGMLEHYPSPLWFSDGDLGHWMHVTSRWPGVEAYGFDHITTQVVVPPRSSLYVASNVVLPWSRLTAWAAEMSARGAMVDSLGKSFEGREIPRLHLPASGTGKPVRAFVISGQHPSEQCGPLAACGIAEFLCSAHPEAKAIRARCETWIVPMINVDGNVHGRNGWTMEDINPFPDFAGACDGLSPKATEDRLLWPWLAGAVRPDVSLHFHGYLGRHRFAELPYDGCYVLKEPESVFSTPRRAEQYRAVCDALYWDTPALTARAQSNPLGPESLDYSLARACETLAVLYEINHGFCGVQGARRKGADVFRAVIRSALAP